MRNVGLMSFELPRNPRDLRFSGESRTLGEPRRKRTLAPPGRSSTRDLYDAEPIATPFVGSLPPPNTPLDFDDNPTTVFDRDGRDVIAGGFAETLHAAPPPGTARLAPPARPPQLPSVVVNLPPADPTVISAPVRPAPPPLAAWLLAAVMLAAVSYFVTPIAFARAQVVLHAKR